MKLTPRIHQAMNKAAALHDGQYRKGQNIPFIAHPIAVAMILSDYTDDEDVIVAALLHDVLEDVAGYSEEEMRDEFGDRVVEMVKGVSEPKDPNKDKSEHLPWHELKRQYFEILKEAPKESVMIAAADKIHNLMSLISLYEHYGEKTWQIFNSTAEDRLWYFEEVCTIISKRLKGELTQRLNGLFNDLRTHVTT